MHVKHTTVGLKDTPTDRTRFLGREALLAWDPVLFDLRCRIFRKNGVASILWFKSILNGKIGRIVNRPPGTGRGPHSIFHADIITCFMITLLMPFLFQKQPTEITLTSVHIIYQEFVKKTSARMSMHKHN